MNTPITLSQRPVAVAPSFLPSLFVRKEIRRDIMNLGDAFLIMLALGLISLALFYIPSVERFMSNGLVLEEGLADLSPKVRMMLLWLFLTPFVLMIVMGYSAIVRASRTRTYLGAGLTRKAIVAITAICIAIQTLILTATAVVFSLFYALLTNGKGNALSRMVEDFGSPLLALAFLTFVVAVYIWLFGLGIYTFVLLFVRVRMRTLLLAGTVIFALWITVTNIVDIHVPRFFELPQNFSLILNYAVSMSLAFVAFTALAAICIWGLMRRLTVHR